MPVINISLPRPDMAGINLERVAWTRSITAHVVWLYLIGCVLMTIIAVYEGLLGSWVRAERLRVRRAEIRERGERARALASGTPELSFIRTVGVHGDDGCLGQPPFETTPLLSVNAAIAGRDRAWSYRSVALSGLSGSTEISPVEEEANGPQSTKFQLPPPSSSRKNGPPRRSSFSL